MTHNMFLKFHIKFHSLWYLDGLSGPKIV
jgi:hypothetical protein